MIKRVPLTAKISCVTLLWSAIVALEEPFERHVCSRLPSWLAFTCRLYPYLRGPGEWPPEWRWWLKYPVSQGGYRFDVVAWRFIILLVVVGLLAAWWFWTRRRSRLNLLHLTVLSGLGLLLLLSIQFLSKNGIPLMTRMISPYYEPTYFLPAAEIDNARDFLVSYPDCLRARNCPTHHMNSHPPGNVLFMWTFFRVAAALPASVVHWSGPLLRSHTVAEWAVSLPDTTLIAAAFAGLAIPAAACLTVIPLYSLGCSTVGHLRARKAIILFLLVPALPMFAPRVDLVYTLIGVTGLSMAVTGFSRRSYPHLAGAGAILSLGAFMTFAILPLVIVSLLVGIGIAWGANEHSRCTALIRLLAQGLVALSGAALVWVLLSTNPLLTYRYVSSNYWDIQAARNYMVWLFYGPYDLLFFAGVPLALLLARAVTRVLRRLWRSQSLTKGEIWLVSFVLTTGILVLSGRLRGEVARTLLYFYPFLALGSQVESDHTSDRGFAWIAAAMLFQAVVFYYTLRVYHGG